MDAVLRTLSLNSPRGGVPSAAAPAWSPRQAEKPVQHFGARAGGGGGRIDRPAPADRGAEEEEGGGAVRALTV
jgi:hypothetical protein